MNTNLMTIQDRANNIMKSFQSELDKGGAGSGPHKSSRFYWKDPSIKTIPKETTKSGKNKDKKNDFQKLAELYLKHYDSLLDADNEPTDKQLEKDISKFLKKQKIPLEDHSKAEEIISKLLAESFDWE